MENGSISWKVIGPPSKKSELWEKGYRGGVEIGSRVVYLLKHRDFNEDGTIRKMAPPRFMVFHKNGVGSTGVPRSREKGMPMSRVEFEDILDFLLGRKTRKKICDQLYRALLEDTKKELRKATERGKK